MNTYGYHITNDSIAAHHAWVFSGLARYRTADVSPQTPEDSS